MSIYPDVTPGAKKLERLHGGKGEEKSPNRGSVRNRHYWGKVESVGVLGWEGREGR